MALLYRTYSGDIDAFGKLRASGAVRDKKLLPKGKPSNEELKKIGEHLRARLKVTYQIGEEIKPDWENYRAAHRELDAMHVNAMDRINKTRLMALIWLRAHQKMASGVMSPAEWFNVKELPAQLIGAGTKAVF